MRRGDVVLVVLSGDYGKPRPAVVIQGDLLNVEGARSVIVAPMTTTLTGAHTIRVPVAPSPDNGLREPSEIMVDKLAAVARERVRDAIGRLDADTMTVLDRTVLVVLGFA